MRVLTMPNIQAIEDVEFLNDNGISIDMVSHDQLYDELCGTGRAPIIVNDYCARFTSDDKMAEMLNALIHTHYGSAELDTIPSCVCGEVRTKANENIVCDNCGEPCERVINRSFTSNVWIRPPKGIPAFISPKFWNVFSRYIGKKVGKNRFDLLLYLTSPTYSVGQGVPLYNHPTIGPIIRLLSEYGIERNITYFYKNFDSIMDLVLSHKAFHEIISGKNKEVVLYHKELLRIIIKNYRHCIFSHRLPFPSKLLLVSEEDKKIGFIDKNIPLALDALKSIVMAERPLICQTQKKLISTTMRANKSLAEYYEAFRTDTYSGKPGLAAKHMCATRSAWSGRATITPKAGIHNYDEIDTPWAFSISLLKVHILNKLLELDMTPVEMLNFIFKCTGNCTGPDGDLMEDIFNTLIDEAPDGGIPLALLRNPTLERLSDQLYKITRVIRSNYSNSIRISVLTIKGKNADFDGDQLQALLMLDAHMHRKFKRLKSHLGLMDTDHPRKVKGIITMHAEMITVVNNFLKSNRVGNCNEDLHVDTYPEEF